MPNLLPGGRLAASSQARVETARPGGWRPCPRFPGRDTAQILAAASGGDIDALVIGGVDLDDLPDPAAARAALEATPFVVSLELRPSPVTDRADVVSPGGCGGGEAGHVRELGRPLGTFEAVLDIPGVESDLHVLRRIADEMDVHLGLPDAAAARQELARWASPVAQVPGADAPAETAHGAALASPRRRPPGAAGGRGPARHLAPAAGRGTDAGRRAVPGRHGPAGGGPDVSGDRGGGRDLGRR